MSSNMEIAKRIVKAILSPDSVIGFFHGVLSVPKDLGYLAYGYMDTDTRFMRESERIRMVGAIKHGILENKNFAETIETVLDKFSDNVPEKKKDSIYSQVAFSMVGRTVTNSVIAGRLAIAVSQSSSLLVAVRGGIMGNILLMGGMAERSIYTSRALQQSDPEIYYALHGKNYDLLYFLVEPLLEPFVEALRVKRTQGQPEFDKILDMVEDELKKSKRP
ncbi:hypothetical protein HZI31_20395 [Serratia fonticola]|uniref:hypothetical protein n=1 Tax=Serratia fonticola TaxID=47917 RepID=UPI0015C63443|nr:hypothetical protein [Serratia fonticola]NYA45657.1 hypothetical protein [Serratia fonticola]